MSPLSQAALLMPLLRAIRDHLGPGEYAACGVTALSFPYVEARTVGGNLVATISEDGLYSLDVGGGVCYTCDPNAPKDVIRAAILLALNDARELRA